MFHREEHRVQHYADGDQELEQRVPDEFVQAVLESESVIATFSAVASIDPKRTQKQKAFHANRLTGSSDHRVPTSSGGAHFAVDLSATHTPRPIIDHYRSLFEGRDVNGPKIRENPGPSETYLSHPS